MNNTRFSPTASSGSMHIGHVVNLAANWWYAIRNNSKFFFAPECTYIDTELSSYVSKCFIVARQFQLSYVCCVPPLLMQGGIVSQRPYLSTMFGNNDIGISHASLETLTAINDYVMGVGAIIRGRDWDPEHTVLDTTIKYLNHKALLEYLIDKYGNRNEIKYYHHPLLLSPDHGKISKSEITIHGTYALDKIMEMWHVMPEYGYQHTMENKTGWIKKIDGAVESIYNSNAVLPISTMVYVMYIIDSNIPLNLNGISTYPDAFNIDKLCGMDNIVVNINDLYDIDNTVRSYISSEYNCKPRGIEALSVSWDILFKWIQKVK